MPQLKETQFNAYVVAYSEYYQFLRSVYLQNNITAITRNFDRLQQLRSTYQSARNQFVSDITDDESKARIINLVEDNIARAIHDGKRHLMPTTLTHFIEKFNPRIPDDWYSEEMKKVETEQEKGIKTVETSFHSPSFFSGLNPASKSSGLTYNYSCHRQENSEIVDRTVIEEIQNRFKHDLAFFEALLATFNVIVGDHYEPTPGHTSQWTGGAKGVLDFLIFPLIARKMLNIDYSERSNDPWDSFPGGVLREGLLCISAFLIAIPLEIARFSVGVALTLLLSPIIAVVCLIKACLPKQPHVDEALSMASGLTA